MGFLNKLVIKDLKTGKPSYTLTAFMVGFFVINIKLIFSGVQFTETFRFSDFSGMDYGACMAALGGVYTLRKNNSIKQNKPEE